MLQLAQLDDSAAESGESAAAAVLKSVRAALTVSQTPTTKIISHEHCCARDGYMIVMHSWLLSGLF